MEVEAEATDPKALAVNLQAGQVSKEPDSHSSADPVIVHEPRLRAAVPGMHHRQLSIDGHRVDGLGVQPRGRICSVFRGKRGNDAEKLSAVSWTKASRSSLMA